MENHLDYGKSTRLGCHCEKWNKYLKTKLEIRNHLQKEHKFMFGSQTHNCMATADRAVVVFVKEFQWNQRPQPHQNGLILHKPKINLAFRKNIQLLLRLRRNFFQLTLSVHNVFLFCFKVMRKTNKLDSDF